MSNPSNIKLARRTFEQLATIREMCREKAELQRRIAQIDADIAFFLHLAPVSDALPSSVNAIDPLNEIMRRTYSEAPNLVQSSKDGNV
jgi:hypothetical protein